MNVRFHFFQIGHHGRRDKRTAIPTDGRTKPPLDLRVRNYKEGLFNPDRNSLQSNRVCKLT